MQRVAVLVLLALAHVAAGAVLEVATGFSWAENLICDPWSQSLFVSEAARGEIYRITFDATTGNYTSTIHVSGYDRFLGYALDDEGTLYVVARKNSTGNSEILVVDKTQPQTVKTVVTLAQEPNGLAWDSDTKLLFATIEHDWLKADSSVISVDPKTGKVTTLINDGWFCDGAYIDQDRHILYVSQVLNDKLRTFNTITGQMIREYAIPSGILNVDDFCLSRDGQIIYGAGFISSTVGAFYANGTGTATTIAGGLQNPTSVRWGCGVPGFPSNSLFVSEGGGAPFLGIYNRRILQITDM